MDAFFKGRMVIGRQIAFIASRTSVEVVAVGLVVVSPVMSVASASQELAAYVLIVMIGKLFLYTWLLTGMTAGHWVPLAERRREFVGYGLPLVPTLLAIWLVGQSDRLVLSHFVSKHDLGLYAFAATFAGYVVFLGYAVYPLLLPHASRLHDEGRAAELRNLFNDSQRLFALLWAGGMACLALWSGEIIAWTGGRAFDGAAPILLVLAFSVGFEHLMGVYQYVFHLKKRTDLLFWLNLANAALIIGSLAVAGTYGGIVVAPWGVLAATIVFNLLRYALASRYVHLPAEPTLALGVAGIAILTFLLARFAAGQGLVLRIILTVLVLVPLAGFTLRRPARPVLESL
jgi:O-antigen/teichoic acid export membrane protein